MRTNFHELYELDFVKINSCNSKKFVSIRVKYSC
jgi:hypothetical protein